MHMKTAEKCFPGVMFIILYTVVLTLASMTIQLKSTEQYFPVGLFIIVTFESVDEKTSVAIQMKNTKQ